MDAIGVIGKGYVGSALVQGFERKGIENIRVFDPIVLPDSNITDVIECDIVFICVPTPMRRDGSIDADIVQETLVDLEHMKFGGIAVIKSTVTPIYVKLFKKEFDISIAVNPEFLTQRNADEDFLDSKWIILGGDPDDLEVLDKFYSPMFPDALIVKVSAEAAMMAKYMCNNWFAVKVALMNEFYRIWKSLNVDGDWEDVIMAFSADDRVGPTHLEVPGPDGDFGFGGACFPKDLSALIDIACRREVVHNVLQAAWDTNKEVRYSRDWIVDSL